MCDYSLYNVSRGRSRRQQSFGDVSFRSKPGTAPSLVGLAAIQYFERVKDSAGLSPKRRFIAAEPIKGEVGKVGETQKAAGELDGGSVGFHPRVGKRFYVAGSTGRSCIAAGGFGPDAVVTEPNRFGPAVVWPYNDRYGNTQIRCFMPGPGT